MLNSTKTWQDNFDENFEETTITIETDSGWTTIPCSEEIKQFISDLRKKDEQQLLLKLSLETQYYGRQIEMKISKIIEEYYAKN